MTVIRAHAFALDDAALTGGAVIAAAGSGLPRRITGGVDYEARVMALGPSGYWRRNESSGNFLDRTGLANITPVAGVRSLAGHAKGGAASAAFKATVFRVFSRCAAERVEHRLVAGTPFAAFVIAKSVGTTTPTTMCGLSSQTSPFSGVGVSLLAQEATPVGIVINAAFAGVYASVAGGGAFDGQYHLFGVRYSGGTITALASWRLCLDGRWFTPSGSTVDPGGPGAQPLGGDYYSQTDGATVMHQSDTAIWSGGVAVPSEAQISALWNVACGTARWTLPVDATQARTLRGWQLPGRLARADLTRLGVRSYYQIGTGPRVEFDPGQALPPATLEDGSPNPDAVTIPSGSACYLDSDLTHYHLDDLPWIADAYGGGPVALYDEADPPPVYVPQPRAAAVAARSAVASAQGRASVATARSRAGVGA